MERRLGVENVHEQLPGEQGVQTHAFALDHVAEPHAALNDNKRAHAQPRHFHTGLDHLVNAGLSQFAPAKEPVRAHLTQGLADV